MGELVKTRLAAITAGQLPIGRASPESATDPDGERPLALRDQPRRFERRHVVVMVGIVLAGLLGTWFWLARTSEVTVPVTWVRPSASAAPAPSQRPGIVVHVTGAVQRPGVVELPAGARVQAAIASAGGLRPDADPGQLNLAAQVEDGAQIIIGTVGAPGGELRLGASGETQAGSGQTATVNLNTATQAQLEALPGVGPATAQGILSWRQKHGKFSRVEELQEIDGIGPKTFAKLAPLVHV